MSLLVKGLQYLRIVLIIILFFNGCISIIITQFVFKTVHDTTKQYFNLKQGMFNLTKKHFIVLISFIWNLVCPSDVRIMAETSDLLPRNSISVVNGNLNLRLKDSSVMIANHQIYTDWVFLWWTAYVGHLGDSVYIFLKDSLRNIPVLGYGMNNFGFIFLSRKWASDSYTICKNLSIVKHFYNEGTSDTATLKDIISRAEKEQEPAAVQEKEEELATVKEKLETQVHSQNVKWPYSFILFPEGTNMSPNRREVSDKYTAQLKLDFKLRHVLLPRTTGLHCVLQQLKGNCKVLYDLTIGYSGVSAHQYGESIYTLGNVFIKGKSPKIIDIYLRAIDVDTIPGLGDSEEDLKLFETWLFDLWQQKDELMESYYKNGMFVVEKNTQVAKAPLKPRGIMEFLSIFAIPGILLLFLRLAVNFIRRFC